MPPATTLSGRRHPLTKRSHLGTASWAHSSPDFTQSGIEIAGWFLCAQFIGHAALHSCHEAAKRKDDACDGSRMTSWDMDRAHCLSLMQHQLSVGAAVLRTGDWSRPSGSIDGTRERSAAFGRTIRPTSTLALVPVCSAP
ncbi:hypothetical protein SNOG_12570 [Parastagonospora nodorum SN15]|uniref:Uncharacterized protein n=1 Tax=Phaeosphaeria nodorum (strain SN15 / ATCC MYA-4574 / FGSC 10173) TaxID=321614 RepID=Q0U6P4_PHANO|nr:hypothetical protein SNOG_12570 [Parastagonospora nodorum SN15]EAT79868.1 hypothetical protein SNOG_12570 [Parastagonospora nodorum SN15]